MMMHSMVGATVERMKRKIYSLVNVIEVLTRVYVLYGYIGFCVDNKTMINVELSKNVLTTSARHSKGVE